MFQTVYDSAWHIPVSAWVAALVAVVLASHRGGVARVYGVAFAIASALDAWLTGPLSPLAEGSRGATVAGIVFVIAGDARFFLAAERLDAGSFRAWWKPALWSFLVPVTSTLLGRAVPSLGANMRATYLVYELLFLSVAVVFLVRARRRGSAASASLATFELVQYALWATADVVILKSGSDLAYLVRLVPNLMYYAAFIPFAMRLLPGART